MKKLFLLKIFMLSFSISSIFAQPCVPGNYPGSGIYPDSVTGLPPAYVNSLYNEVVTVVVPTDTVLDMGLGPMFFTIDSIGIIGIAGLPTGFTISTNPANGYIHGNASGCVLITGTPGIADIGAHPLTITLESWVNGIAQGFVDQQTYYTLHVLDTTVSIENTLPHNTEVINYPNPFSKETVIEFNLEKSQELTLSVYNNLGQKRYNKVFSATSGRNTINIVLNEPDGIYHYTVKGKDVSLRNVMMIKN